MMDPEDRRMLTEIYGSVQGIKPTLAAHEAAILKQDDRSRAFEVKQGEHEVKIDRIQDDLDGLGRKLRARIERRLANAPESDGAVGRWLTFLEVLAALPKYAHVLMTIGSLTLAGLVIALKMHGG